MECNFSKDGQGAIEVEATVQAQTQTPAPALVPETAKVPVNEMTAGGQRFENVDALLKAQAEAANNVAALEAQLAAARAQANAIAPGVPAKIQSGAIAPSGIILGDVIPEFKDIILPRINIVQGVGKLKDQFTQGAIVFGQNAVLFEPPLVNARTGNMERAASPPVSFTILGFRPTRFVEKIQGGQRGMIVDTEDQVRASGGTLDYREWNLKKASGMKRFEPLAEALVAIARPECCADDDTLFTYPVGERKYALGLWAMKGSAYTHAAKRVFFTQRAVGCLKGGYPTCSFSLTTRLEPFDNGNSAWVPVCIYEAKSTPDFIEFARAVLNPA